MTAILRHPLAEVEPIIAIALEAGELVTAMRDAGLDNIQRKSSAIDIVTEADLAAEKLIRSRLSALDSSLGFWGEESNMQPVERAYWVVDPIDGTNNFAMGLPLYAVNVALQDGPETLIGVTVELPSRRIFWTVAGEGAHLRSDGSEQRLHVSCAKRLENVFLTTGFPYHRAQHPDNNSAEHLLLLTRAQGVRCLGASALDFAYVASGVFGGCWEGWLKPWDVAAGALMVREAGGKVTNYQCEEWTLQDQSAIASNGHPDIHDAIQSGIHQARSSLTESLL